MNDKRWGVGLALLLAHGCAGKSTLGSGRDNKPSMADRQDASAVSDAGVDVEGTQAEQTSRPADTTDATSTNGPGSEGTSGGDASTSATELGEPIAPTGAPNPTSAPTSSPTASDGITDEMTDGPEPADSHTALTNSEPTGMPPTNTAPVATTPAPTNSVPDSSSGGAPDSPEMTEEEAEAAVCEYYENLQIVGIEEVTPNNDQAYSDEECDAIEAQLAEPQPEINLEVAPLAGTWRDGTGEESIELQLDATGHGSVRYGDPVELPAPDAATAYLVDEFKLLGSWAMLGFTYDLLPIDGRASEMRAQRRVMQPWGQWCSLQEPKRGPFCYKCDQEYNNGYFFNHSGCGVQGCFVPVSTESDVYAQVDCGRYALCLDFSAGGVCECSSTGCRADSSAQELVFTLDPVDLDVLRVPGRSGSETRYLVRDP